MVACEVSELSLQAAACSWAVSMYSFSTAAFSCLCSPPFSKATVSDERMKEERRREGRGYEKKSEEERKEGARKRRER